MSGQKITTYYDTPMPGVEQKTAEATKEKEGLEHHKQRRELNKSLKAQQESPWGVLARNVAPATYRKTRESVRKKGVRATVTEAVMTTGREVLAVGGQQLERSSARVGKGVGEPRFAWMQGYSAGARPAAFSYNPRMPQWALRGGYPWEAAPRGMSKPKRHERHMKSPRVPSCIYG